MDDLLREFITESNESLATLDQELVKLERNPDDPGLIGNIFRLVHTVKGTCGFLGLPRLERTAHAGENVLGKLRDGELEVTPVAVSLILESLDRIKFLLGALEATGAEPEGDDRELTRRLDAFAEGGTVPAASCPAPAIAATADDAAVPRRVEARESALAAQSIRVNVDLLETLMTMVSELVLTRNQLLQIQRGQEESGFAGPLQRLNQVTSELQEGVMKTRMQPIGNAWAKLPRMVRDLSLELGKKIELAMRGADTELDRQVLELIKDPLTHMVRNSADHGLEAPADRRAAGKAETGRITLNAFHEGGHIIIEVADDGRGLPLDKIRAKAIANGLATEAEIAGMSDQQISRFIFNAGLSTASSVSNVSGRGVGMDVVKTNIEKIGGTIELETAAGKGSTFVVKIPLTLAIVSALIVECARERFAIPQIAVLELVRVAAGTGSRIERINGSPLLRLRNRLLPLVDLGRLLRLCDDTAKIDEAFVVVTQVGTSIFGIMVDRVFDTEEIVVKPVAPILRDIPIFSGNTILGDGSVIMILDPNGIAVRAGERGADAAARDAQAHPAARDDDRISLLTFRAGDQAQKAVPLALVTRLEEVDAAMIELSNGRPVVQYRGRLMPLVPVDDTQRVRAEGRQPILVFADGTRSMGLMVDEIIDIVEERLQIELKAERAGLMGSAIVADKATEIIDTQHYLTKAFRDWFGSPGGAGFGEAAGPPKKVLLVDDSPFFRNLLAPLLMVAGYEVTTAESADQALGLCEAGKDFDVIVSDIEMPGMNGFEFAAAVRESSRWQSIPMLALTSHTSARDLVRGRQAGFVDYIAKSDRDGLLGSLSQTISNLTRAA